MARSDVFHHASVKVEDGRNWARSQVSSEADWASNKARTLYLYVETTLVRMGKAHGPATVELAHAAGSLKPAPHAFGDGTSRVAYFDPLDIHRTLSLWYAKGGEPQGCGAPRAM
jgi:hypothetical protein